MAFDNSIYRHILIVRMKHGSVSTMPSKPTTIEDLQELVRKNPENHRSPARAVTEFTALIEELHEHQVKATGLTAELRDLMAEWTERRGDVKFRERYARVKTQRDTANKRYYNGARRANKLLGQNLIKSSGWRIAPRGGERDV
jgi:hypothetical protein